MEEFVTIFRASVGRVGSARCFSLGVSTYTQRDVSAGYHPLKTRGAEGPNGSLSEPSAASSAQAATHSVSTWLRLLTALLQLDSEKPPKSEFKRRRQKLQLF